MPVVTQLDVTLLPLESNKLIEVVTSCGLISVFLGLHPKCPDNVTSLYSPALKLYKEIEIKL